MKRRNPEKERFLRNFPTIAIEDQLNSLKTNISFSLKYFDKSQSSGQDFCDWTKEQLEKLLNKLKNYTDNTVMYWRNQRIGAGGLKVLEIYGGFPSRSEFTHPKHVPIDVLWARFRLENDMRLIGFFIPNQLVIINNIPPNIFYIVFLDQNHKFYLTEEK